MSEQHGEREQRVTPLELLFDLVFVFAFTQSAARMRRPCPSPAHVGSSARTVVTWDDDCYRDEQ